MSKDQDIDKECFDCPLPDCYPTDARCPVLRRKSESAGFPLPDVTNIDSIPKRGRPCVPFEYKNRADYQRKYKWNTRKVYLKGVKIRRTDIDILRAICEENGRTLEGELVTLLEEMAEKARLARGCNG